MPALAPETAPLTIRLFGPLSVRVEGAPLPPLRSRKGLWLLALLTLRHGRDLQRAWVAGLLWPDSSEPQAFASLRQSLADLRRALGSQAYRLTSPTPQTIRFDLTGASVDVAAFDQAIARGDAESLAEAVALYPGPLLEDLAEEWGLQERLVREQAFLKALETLAAFRLEAQAPAEAAGYLRRALAADPLSESVCVALMQALAAAGDYAEATQVYREMRLRLRREMNLEPSQETQAAFQRIRAEARRLGEKPPSSTPRPVVMSGSSPRVIPHPLTPLIGREEERAAILSCLERARLVTLTGTGGVGKTRLSIQVAEDSADDYPDGVRFVELAAIDRPALVAPTVAAVLEVREEPGRSLAQALTDHLKTKSLLLVLDNCEHVLEGCGRLAMTLLQACPGLRILATSRQPLGLPGEVLQRVPSLSLPEETGADLPSPEQMERYDALRFFVERARSASPGFALNVETAAATLLLCRRLDGIPLALELAAARLKALSVHQVAARLDDRFRLLTGGSRSALPRQQTLKALLDWSYDLLTGEERLLLNRLSVFAGGWNLEAVEAIGADDALLSPEAQEAVTLAGTLNSYAILDLLTQLIDKSLVIHEARGAVSRYRLLETVAQYGRDRLSESGEADAIRQRHADYFLAQAQTWSGQLSGAQSSEALPAFSADLENVRRGMDWSLENHRQEATVAYGKAMFAFLRTRGLYEECASRLTRATEAAQALEDKVSQARLLNQRGLVAWERFQLEEARALFTESYAISESLGDKTRMLSALINLGNISWGHSEYAEARRIYESALPLAVTTAQKPYEAALRLNLGILAIERGDYAEAEDYLAASLRMHQELQNEEYVGHTLYNFSELHRKRGEYSTALSYAQESHRVLAEIGHRRGLALAKVRIGLNLFEQGQPDLALPFVHDGMKIAQEIGDRAGQMYALEVQARLVADRGDLTEAQALFRHSLRIARQAGDHKQIAQTLAHYGDVLNAMDRPEEAALAWSAAGKEYACCELRDLQLERKLEVQRAQLTPQRCAYIDAQLAIALPEDLLFSESGAENSVSGG